jgi:hypothetical protein
MRKIQIYVDGRPAHPGTLPTGWHDTPLAAYVALATATDVPSQCQAVAQLVGVPAEPFLSNVQLLVPIRQACPWLFDGSLPETGLAPVPSFTHKGVTYRHVGNLETISAQQFEALLAFLRENEAQPLRSAPHLLAVLYCPINEEQTAEVVDRTAAAFASLPMAQAWPALHAFFLSSGKQAASIRLSSELVGEATNALTTLEEALSLRRGVSPGPLQSIVRWLVRHWLRLAKRRLATS